MAFKETQPTQFLEVSLPPFFSVKQYISIPFNRSALSCLPTFQRGGEGQLGSLGNVYFACKAGSCKRTLLQEPGMEMKIIQLLQSMKDRYNTTPSRTLSHSCLKQCAPNILCAPVFLLLIHLFSTNLFKFILDTAFEKKFVVCVYKLIVNKIKPNLKEAK